MSAPASWWIARNELRRIVTDRAIFLFGLALPVVIIVLVGSTFGSVGAIGLGVVDQDGSAASASMLQRLEGRAGIHVSEKHSVATLRRDVRSTALDGGLVIPKGYGASLEAGAAEVEAIVDPASAGTATAVAAIQSAIDQEGVQQGAVRLVASTSGSPSLAARQVEAAAASLERVAVVDSPGTSHRGGTGTFSYTAPANLVLFVFINTFAVSTLLANDRRQGLISRMLVTPNRPGSVLLGLGASKLAFALVQSSLILVIGRVLFGVHWGDPLGAAALVVVFAALSTAIGQIVGSVVRNADQAQSIGIPLAVGMGMLGGCMWPLYIVPDTMRTVGHIVPQAWAMDAWQELIFDGGGLRAILPELAVLGGATVVLSTVAVRQLRRSILH